MRIAYLNAIKSISQRALVQHWREIGDGIFLPSLERFAPDPRAHDARQLMFWTIEGENEKRRFKTLQHGKFLAEAFGGNPLPLQVVPAVVPPGLQQIVLDALHACADARAPVYSVISTHDEHNHRINCERLLLPFGDQHGEPRQIVVALQLISLDGKFTRQTALAHFAANSTVTFMAQIAFNTQTVPASST